MGVCLRARAPRLQTEKARQEQEEEMEISDISNLGEQEVPSRTGVSRVWGYLGIIAVITYRRGGRHCLPWWIEISVIAWKCPQDTLEQELGENDENEGDDGYLFYVFCGPGHASAL